MTNSDELLQFNSELLKYLDPPKRARVERLLAQRRSTWNIWQPLPGPQTQAYVSPADVVGYGGAAGGGKTDLAIGLALTQHQRTAIFRQTGTELTAIIDRIGAVLKSTSGFSSQKGIWKLQRPDGMPIQLELGSFPNPKDEQKYQGRPHDLLVFDEASNMREIAVRFLMGWLRTEDPDQRCRALMCFNPPTSVEGRWVIKYFAPWIDKRHPNPAEYGELRWFATIDGKDREVETSKPFMHEGERITPKSRTFIASRVSDNPYYAETGYMAQLQSLEEPLRSQMLHGDFSAGMEDDKYQVIPTAWIEAAMEKWTKPPKLEEMDSIGLDVALGGDDDTVIARRHGMWFDEPVVHSGKECIDGDTIAGFVVGARRNNAVVHVDVFGVGAMPYGSLMQLGVQAIPVNVGDPTGWTSKSGQLRFKNIRSELWWKMREALDPSENTGIMLPPDQRLLADLAAPTWQRKGAQIYVEGREELVKKIGRSPDYGSAYCLALLDTMKEDVAYELLLKGKGKEYDPYENL